MRGGLPIGGILNTDTQRIGEHSPLTSLHRYLIGFVGVFFLPLLTGCQGESIVAQVGNQSIGIKTYYNVMENLTQADFANAPDFQVGPLAMLYLIREAAIQQIAQQKGFMPSSSFIDHLVEYQREHNPNLDFTIKQGLLTENEVRKQLTLEYEILAIGADTNTVDDAQLRTLYNQLKPQLDLPERVSVRMLQVKDEQDGIQTINRLRATGNFSEEANREKALPPFNGQEILLPVAALKVQLPQMYQAIQNLSPGQFASAPVLLKQPQNPAPVYVVVQLTHKFPAKSVSFEEARPALFETYLQQHFPQATYHFYRVLADYLNNLIQQGRIIIYNQRYAKIVLPRLMQLILAQSSAQPGGVVPGGMVPPAAPGSSATRPHSRANPNAAAP